MKRSWNWPLWTGALLVFAGVVSYPLLCVRIPALRDFPWANLPLIAIGLALLAVGLARAFRRPELHRGRIFGTVLAVLSLGVSGLFLYGIFTPESTSGAGMSAEKTAGVVLIFYRGYW
jgi:hypothetical protein